MKIAPMAAVLALSLCTVASADSPTAYTPNTVHWAAGTGTLAGTQVAVLRGDPAKPGPFTMRIRIPNGVAFAPHWHSSAEGLTVLQGTFLVGVGDRIVKSKMMALPAGSWGMMPKATHHYGIAKGVTIVQIDGMGPFDMHMVHAGTMHV